MAVIDDVLKQSVGAEFLRADLHIHSHGASHDVKDSAMTPENIVKTAAAEGLSLVALTDHNEISNVEAAIQASAGTTVTVIPGVELSTPQGHLLCYLPSLDDLRSFHAKLSIADRNTPNSRCQQQILDCLNLLEPLGGFGILAHVDIKSGFEIENPGASPHKVDVLVHPALLGIELKDASSDISYSESDPDATRAKFGRDRIAKLKLGSKQFLARVLNSDAHAPGALGRNAQSLRRVTRYKMDSASFHGLRVALEDADARVRIEDQIPPSLPMIEGAYLDGGFLAGGTLRFSRNLNCIIGGRGTGKSTVFESIRCLADASQRSKVVDSEVWPEELSLFWKDQAGVRHSLSRHKDNEVQNLDDPIMGPRSFDIDCFGQGEAAQIGHEAQSDPLALMRYLDRFVELEDALEAEEAAREELLELQTKIEEATRHAQQIPQYQTQLTTTQQQLTALKKPDVKELIELQQHLASEKELRRQISDKLQEAKEAIRQGSPRESLDEIRTLSEADAIEVGKTEFQAILNGASAFEVALEASESKIATDLSGFENIVTAQIKEWVTKEAVAQKRVDAKRKELEGLNVRFDNSYIAKLAKDEAKLLSKLKELQGWKKNLDHHRKTRRSVLKQRWQARAKVATLRDAFACSATHRLKEGLSDLHVSLKYTSNALSPDGEEQIIQAMGWRTVQQERASALVRSLTIPALLTAIEKRDSKPIEALKTPEGVKFFKPKDARDLLDRLAEESVRFALERVEVFDLPRLHVTKQMPDGNGKTKPVVREFQQLSLGQQQSVLLALILSADTDKPLIIDQPEDNLDGEFIYATLVPVLRRAKERRQVIIVTHNANVAVLGDAEQIFVMKALSDRGQIVARGSIDHQQTRDYACNILEGAREAFLRRAKMYGVRVKDA